MAHVLLGWELGAGSGHARPLKAIGAALAARGHRISYALQQTDALAPAEGEDVWQAPVSPRLLVSSARPAARPPATMGDILARVGFDDAGIVAANVSAWRRLVRAVRPDVVVADFAPSLLLAVRGEVPSVSVGDGFVNPPASMPRFPSLTGAAASYDEEQLLAAVSQGLRSAGARPIERLPEVFAAERTLAASFAELDPYAAQRPLPASPPSFDFPLPSLDRPPGDEVFVYALQTLGIDAPLWKGLAEAGLPTRVHVARVDNAYREALAGMGFLVEAAPVPFAEIAARSRVTIAHGHGFASSALVSGLPHVVFHYDIEKLCLGLAVARLGVGGHVPLHAIDPPKFAASLRQLYADASIARRSRDLAATLRARLSRDYVGDVVEAVEALA